MCHGRDGTTSHLIGGRGSRLQLSIKYKTYSISGEMHYMKDFSEILLKHVLRISITPTILIDDIRTTILFHFLN
jgi:hypothetical protein